MPGVVKSTQRTNHQVVSAISTTDTYSPFPTSMLRRKPTALTITSEDVASFVEAHLRRLAYARYLKTGEDPQGLFRNGGGPDLPSGADSNGAQMSADAASGNVDPNDELKPLPGDKARIVRSREERIMGQGHAAGRER